MGGNNPSYPPLAVIMAGGSGTRFWPLSQKKLPKQYLKLSDDLSLIQKTVERVQNVCALEHIFICSGESQFDLIQKQLPQIKGLILEPQGKNTAACVMLSVAHLLRKGYSLKSPLMVFPADHYIGNLSRFVSLLEQAVDFAQQESSLITLGIVPTSPHTGYGYIETEPAPYQGSVYRAKRFTEKPNAETAKGFLSSKRYFWNSGIFIWTLESIVEAFEQHLGDTWKRFLAAREAQEIAGLFATLPSVPIDTAVMEKASNLFLIPADQLEWSDVGSWSALYDLKTKTPQQNVSIGGTLKELDSQGCLVHVSPKTKVALIGIKDLIIVEHEGKILIADKKLDQKVKDISTLFDET